MSHDSQGKEGVVNMSGLSLDTSLLWTAQEIFLYPNQENLAEQKNNIQKLLDWVIGEGLRLDNTDVWKEALVSGTYNLEQLEVDFTALFINSFPTARAHPFAGWYEGEAIIFGPSDNKVRQFYSRYGVSYDANNQIPADHIMVELEFLARMAEEYERTGEILYYTAMQEMMAGYFENWVFKFLHNMETYAETSYYKSLASILVCLLTKLRKELKGVA